LDFVMQTAGSMPAGARVLDLGAGDAPYRELFAHVEYTTSDWENSLHEGAAQADLIAAADALPVADGSFDLVLCTQVLEHVPEPDRVLAECFRILAPDGILALTVPLLYELHELPHDYHRFTENGLRRLLSGAGFVDLEVTPRSSGFAAVAQLLLNLRWAMGDAPDGLGEQRRATRELLSRLSEFLAELEPLDVQRSMPLGYCASARRP
jgi:SAM-dependent methyltransferase